MKRFFELLPTFILLGIFIFSLYIKNILHGAWINLFAIGLVGLFLYSPFALYVDALTEAYHGKVKGGWRLKLFQGYLSVLWFGSIAIGIFLMNHN
ncbi:LasU family protein [Companilactobacillus kimchiensis]|uniref:LasU family protein n=1 Tax=Companilactobacillus kimchiensis TaxID=993692 RepID=UPI00070ECE6C|nr:LasU family protein [Companilactobacillus kimchiensis]